MIPSRVWSHGKPEQTDTPETQVGAGGHRRRASVGVFKKISGSAQEFTSSVQRIILNKHHRTKSVGHCGFSR